MKRFLKTLQSMKGFTWVGLMIVVAVIGILAAIAIPSYQQYTRKSKFTEVIAATGPYKLSVDLCYQDGTCQGGTTAALDKGSAKSSSSEVLVGSCVTECRPNSSWPKLRHAKIS